MDKIPVSVIVVTKNEEESIARCLAALQDFAEIIVVDSHSTDRTCDIARDAGACVVPYEWNGRYPKKRQWCLEVLDIAHDWVFWVDADEVVTLAVIEEIRGIFRDNPQAAGFFVRGQYIWRGMLLKHGLQNNKIALFNRHKMMFPVVDDLDIPGMGEIEGHYQPVCKDGCSDSIGQIAAPLLHYASEDEARWEARHIRYAQWEAAMTKGERWPDDPVYWRDCLKKLVRRSALRSYLMFFYSYVAKCGFLDGKAGYDFALSRKKYCHLILSFLGFIKDCTVRFSVL